MSPSFDYSGGPRHRAPGTGVGREDPAGTGARPGHQRPAGPTGAAGPTGPDGATPPARANGGSAGAPDTGRPADTDPVDDGFGVDAIESELDTARRERDEYLDMVRRLQADFENYKKRTVRQQSDQLERASESLVAKLLPALDAFELTVAHLPDHDAASPEVKALLQAAGLVIDALTKEGLERIHDAGAPFDPTVHDAVEHAPADEIASTGATTPIAATAPTGATAGSAAPGVPGATPPPPTPAGPVVADVLRSGYRWKGRVIRPAMVRVRG
jgi:molecular chaperone GrpE